MCPPPKPAKPKAPPPPVEAPVIELGNENPNKALRERGARGRNQLRTGLNITAGSSNGLSIPM